MSRVQTGVERMGRQIEELLGSSRLGRRQLNLQPASLGEIVAQVRTDINADIPDRHIEWKIGGLPLVECDHGLMKQVFANLLANAVKDSRQRRQIRHKSRQ